MNDFGPRLKALRLKNKITQKQVASYLHIDRTTYTGYESGKRFPDAQILCMLADLFDVSVDHLLGR